jgi:hypothetical protein
MGEPQPATGFDVECPHCHKQFSAEPMEGRAARYHGFKCPHCRLFVPYQRAAERDLLGPVSTDSAAE